MPIVPMPESEETVRRVRLADAVNDAIALLEDLSEDKRLSDDIRIACGTVADDLTDSWSN